MILRKSEKLISITIVFIILMGTLLALSGCTKNKF